MSKDTTLKFVGQPIFAQVLKMIDRSTFDHLVRKHGSDRYYKEFKSWDHFVSLMFGILSRCDSIAEIVDGMAGLSGKLEYLRLDKVPAKSTFSDGMRNRSDKFFEELYFALVKTYSRFLSDSKIILSKQFKQMLLIDSTTISLFSEVLKGVGRNRKDDGKKKGGAKVHMVINASEQIGQFVAITQAKTHDKQFLDMINPKPHSLLVFDRAYNHYLKFAQWTQSKVFFVTRKKSNASYTVLSTQSDNQLKDKAHGVHLDQTIELSYKQDKEDKEDKEDKVKEVKEVKEVKKLHLRMVTYVDEQGRKYHFITNAFEQLTADEVAQCYKKRWDIELLFKKMKQNFQLHYFYGENETAIKTQIWCTLIAHLLLTVLQKKHVPQKAFSTVACTIRIHLTSMLSFIETIKNDKRYYRKESPTAGQPDLFGLITPKRKVRKRRNPQKSDGGHFPKHTDEQDYNIDCQHINSE